MTPGRLSSTKSDLAVILIAIGAVVAVGSIVFGPKPTLIAVGVPMAGAAALYVIRRPLVMLIAMVVIEVSNLSGVVAERSPLPVAHISVGLGLLAVGFALRDPVMRGRLNRWTLVCVGLVGCYFVSQLLAALGSQNVDVSMTWLTGSASICVFLVVVLLLAQLSGKPWAVAATVVVSLAVLSVLTLVSLVGFGGAASFGGFATVTKASGELITTPRYGGPLPDSNFWGRHLIMGVPLAGALIVRAARSGRQRVALGWTGAMLALLIGVYLTQSRGTFIATAVVFVVWSLASGPTARRWGLMSLPLAALVFLLPGIGNRLVTVATEVSDSGPDYGVDPSILGRKAVQEISWAMFRDRPMFGFGPDVFKLSIPRYAGMVHTAVLSFEPGPDAPHNIYAQLAAESGIVGLLGWTIFVGGFIACIAIRVVRLSTVNAESDRSLAAAVLAALVGWSVASIFLHLAYFRTFAIMLAFAGALASAASPDLDRAVRVGLGRMREVLLGTVFGIATAATLLAASTTETHTASQMVTILPTEQMKENYAYAFNVRSRPVLLSTYAAMMVADDSGVTAIADSVRGVITISVTDADEHAARVGLERALGKARTHLANFGADSSYMLASVGEIEQKTGENRSIRWTAVAVMAGAAVAIGTVLAVRRRSTRRPRYRRVNGRNQKNNRTVGLPA